ncbi:hypothetical protein T08_5817 [Trichinella sp. T8]|nr:hypothetical protein T08_5817 [Trichinella sp. T8]
MGKITIFNFATTKKNLFKFTNTKRPQLLSKNTFNFVISSADIKVTQRSSSTFATNTSSQLDVLRHDGDALSVNSAQVGIFKQANQVSLSCFLKIDIEQKKIQNTITQSKLFHLQCANSCRLETQVGFEILRNFTNQTLERKFADQKFSGLLITTNFTQRDSSYKQCNKQCKPMPQRATSCCVY